MRRLVLMLMLAAAAPSGAVAGSLAVNIDQGARVTLSKPAHDVMVGNPAIVDVTVLDERHLMVLGKSYGVTNIMVADNTGRTIFSRQVVVSAPDDNRVSVYRGADVYNYACAPRCERTPMPGERESGQGVYSQWAPAYSAYAERGRAAQQNASQSSSAP